jgi:hypothetical protein
MRFVVAGFTTRLALGPAVSRGASLPLYRCTANGSGEHFDATEAACGGHTSQGPLGYLRVNL